MRGDGHIDKDELELYILNQLPERRAEAMEEHLLVCPECQSACRAEDQMMPAATQALNLVEELLVEVHHTEDGLIEIIVRPESDRWVGRITGRQIILDGGFWEKTREQAIRRAAEDFIAMFPEHRCTSQCLQSGRVNRVS